MVDGIGSSLSGLVGATTRMANASSNIAQATSKPGVRLEQEIVNMQIDSTVAKANAKALKAQLDTQKEVLDILV